MLGPLWIFLILIHCSGYALVKGDHQSYRLIKDLFSEYDPNIRSVLNSSTKTNVTILLYVSEVLDLDERDQTLKTNVWLTMEWIDEYLRWNQTDYDVKSLKIASDKLWLPDLVLYENAEKYENFLHGKLCVVSPNGYVNWASPVIFLSHCKIDVIYFPFDLQYCSMKFGTWQHDANEVYLGGTGDETVFKSDGEWDMEKLSIQNNIKYYPDAPKIPYTDVTYTIILRRRPLYYCFNLILPCAIISAITLLGFFLPADSGEKINLGITTLLSLTVFLLVVAETMPPSSNVPVIGRYFAVTMVLVSLSLALTVVVLNCHHRGPYSQRVPGWIKKLLFVYLVRVIRVKRYDVYSECEKNSKTQNTNQEDSETRQPLNEVTPATNSNCTEQRPIPNECMPTQCSSNPCNGNGEKLQITLEHILGELKCITGRYSKQDRTDKVQNEWKEVALILDTLFLSIYFLAICITTIVIVIQFMH